MSNDLRILMNEVSAVLEAKISYGDSIANSGILLVELPCPLISPLIHNGDVHLCHVSSLHDIQLAVRHLPGLDDILLGGYSNFIWSTQVRQR